MIAHVRRACSVRVQVLALVWCATLLVHGYCPNSGQTLTSTSGLITDGTGSHFNGISCSWIISPSGAKSVTLSFSLFQTESCCEFLRVYSCSDTSCNSNSELGKSPFSGFSIPLNVTSNTGIMKVSFESDGSTVRSGFTATYMSTTSSACPTGEYSGADGGCYSCSNRPINSYYTSNGGASSIGCTWQCDSGYYRTSSGACKYEYFTSRQRCSTGTYLTSGGLCSSCTNKPSDAHYVSNGGACSWICNDGYVSDGSRCYSGPATSVAGKAVSSVLGLFLLIPICVIAVKFRAIYDYSSSAAASQQLQNQCCICLTTFNSRRMVLGASGVLAVLTLILTIAADALPTVCGLASGKLGLAGAAYFFHIAGGLMTYSLSSCGCSLCTPAACCQCSRSVCTRTVQATTALGFSISFWVIAQLFFIYNLIGLDSTEKAHAYYTERGSYYMVTDPLCLYGDPVPPGLVSIAGTLNAAALVLQGHFVTLVPEALAAAAAREMAPAQTPPHVQTVSPRQDNTQFNVLAAHIFMPGDGQPPPPSLIPSPEVPASPPVADSGSERPYSKPCPQAAVLQSVTAAL
jgi:hypothetical protein